MGRNAGGVNPYSKASGGDSVAVTSSGRQLSAKQVEKVLSSAEPLDSLEHREVVKQLNRAISRYESVMGVRERSVMVADIGNNYGVTFISEDGARGIYLNKSFFNQSRNEIEAQYRQGEYASGHKNLTNRPIQHTATHELAHATWASSYKGTAQKAAGVEINSLYSKWKKDTSIKGYGSYARKNVDEFWAETITKGIHGNSDKYTKAAISIAKRYKL